MVQQDEVKKKQLLQVALTFGSGSFVSFIFLLWGRRNLVMIDASGIAMLVTISVVINLINFCGILGEVSADMRGQQLYLIIVSYHFMSLHMAASWLPNFITRVLFTLI